MDRVGCNRELCALRGARLPQRGGQCAHVSCSPGPQRVNISFTPTLGGSLLPSFAAQSHWSRLQATPRRSAGRYQHRLVVPTGARGGRPGLPGAGEQGRAGTAGPCPGTQPSLACPQPPVGPLCSACSVLTDCSKERPPFSHLVPCAELSSECQRAHGTQDSPGAAPPPSLPRGRATQVASETRGRRRSPEGRRRPGALGGRSCLGNPVERVST